MADWSELPFDVLEHLTSFLPIQDYHRFGAVCRNWSMATNQKRHSPAVQLPWLALDEQQDSKKRRFYSLSENRHYDLDVPELRGKFIYGSSYGWLFTLDRKLNSHLLNPFTKECYRLPNPPPSFEGYFDGFDVKPYLEAESDDEEAHGRVRVLFESSQRTLVLKGILDYDPSERSDFTAVILFGEDHMPAFWKPGDNAWTVITGLSNQLNDVTFFKGKFYTVPNPVDASGTVLYSFEAGPDPNVTEVEPRVPWHGDPNYVMPDIDNDYSWSYLVVFGGELFLVERFWTDFKEVRTITTEFLVHKLDLKEGKYSTCRHIDGGALFLSNSAWVVIRPDRFLKCRKDAIYFIDLELGDSELNVGGDLRIYDLVENDFVGCYRHSIIHHRRADPIWFAPNPW